MTALRASPSGPASRARNREQIMNRRSPGEPRVARVLRWCLRTPVRAAQVLDSIAHGWDETRTTAPARARAPRPGMR